jgi:predicted MPP superfamily phosphohydrolase
MALRPDLILLPGDYHQGSPATFERELPGLRALFARLRAPGGVFAVQGDQESVENARRIFAGTGARLLADEIATTRVGDRRITIGGLVKHDRGRPARVLARRLERQTASDDVRLLLVHHPDPVLRLEPNSRVDLVVAGHTHGGQLQVPFLGPLSTASRVPRDVAAGGLSTLEGRRIYVSRGIGVERGAAPKLRLGAPPEVSLLTLD